MAEKRFKFVEFSVGVQLDEPLTEAQIEGLGDDVMNAACGGCEVCDTRVHCDNRDHPCKRLVVMGERVVDEDAPDEEVCSEPMACDLPVMHEGQHRAQSRFVRRSGPRGGIMSGGLGATDALEGKPDKEEKDG